MSRVVLTRNMLILISEGICDRRIILTDDLAEDAPNLLQKELELCDKVDSWINSIYEKRGYNEK